jgi:Tfp pilus assembly protein PilF
MGLTACSSTQPPPRHPDDPPPFEQQGAAVAASSSEVQAGMDAIQAGDFARAKAVLSEARKDAPKDPQAAFYLGVALSNLAENEAAEASYRAALELDPGLADAAVNLSALLLEAGEAKQALAVSEAGLAKTPNQPDLLQNQALAAEALEDAPKALAAYEKLVQARPDDLSVRYAYAKLLVQAGRKDDAKRAIEPLAKSEDPAMVQVAATVYGQLKEFDTCVKLLSALLDKTPTPDVYVRRGGCKHGAKDNAGAKADYEAALKLEPKFAPAHLYLGLDYREAGDAKRARASLEKAVEFGQGTPVGQRAEAALAKLPK